MPGPVHRDRPLFWALVAVSLALLLNELEPQMPAFWRRTVGDPISFFTAVLAVFTIVLAWATIRQGALTQRSIDLARAEFLATHRPRIRIRHITAPDGLGDKRFVMTITVVNVGESTATIIDHSMAARLIDNEGIRAATIFRLDGQDRPPIRLKAGQRYEFRKFSAKPVPERDAERFRGNKGLFAVDGVIIYADDEGLKRTTSFSRWHDRVDNKYRIFEPEDEEDYED